MSKISMFLKSNKVTKGTTTFAATESLKDENGKPLEWTIKPITTDEEEAIQDVCRKADGTLNWPLFQKKVMCACIVEPDLNTTELLESYGADDPEELLTAMIDNPVEYREFASFIMSYSNPKSEAALVNEAKN